MLLLKQQSAEQKVLRICISGLASPLWGYDGRVALHDQITSYDQSLLKFLIALKALIRDAYAVCMLTIPTSIFEVSMDLQMSVCFNMGLLMLIFSYQNADIGYY